MRILIVDDSPDDRLLLKTILNRAGFDDLLFASGAREAFSLLAMETGGGDVPLPDLILMDVMMPEIDGIEACSRIKSGGRVNGIPVIMVTGKAEARDLRAAFDAGATDYITKPYNKVELVARVNAALAMRRAQQELRQSEKRMRDIAGALGEGLYVLDAQGHLTFMNAEAERLLGWTEEELIGSDMHEKIHFQHEDGTPYLREHCPVLDAIRTGELHRGAGDCFTRKDGSHFPVEFVAAPLFEEGTVVGSVTAFQDITARREAEAGLRLSAKVIQNALEGIMVTDPQARIQSVNPAFTSFTGYTAAEVVGKNPSLLKSERQDEEFYRRMWETLKREGQWQGEIWNRHKSGDIYPEWLSISAIKDERGQVTQYMGIFSDISALKLAEQRLEHLATHDMLTGLPNRMLLLDRLNQAMARARREKNNMALFFIDLDRFKPINDTYGHDAGDRVLQEVAWRLKSCVRETDTVARIGGDEFVVVLLDVTDEEDAASVAEKIIHSLAEPVRVQGDDCSIGGSVGIVLYAEDGHDAEELIAHADVAMYHVKQSGRNSFAFFHRLDARAKSVPGRGS